MLPFLKNRNEGAGAGDDNTIQRKPDETKEYELLDAVAEDIMAAIEKKDMDMLKGALQSLCNYIQSVDEEQDQLMMGDET